MRWRWRSILNSLSLLVLLGCGGSDGGVEPTPNTAPTLSIQVDSEFEALVPNDPILLEALVSDADGDPLTIVWRTAPAGLGSFTDSTTARTTWIAGSEVGSFRIVCVVSDGVNASVTRQTSSLVSGTPLGATNYTADVVWTAAESPYVLLGDLTVEAGATLRIEPGVRAYLRASVLGPSSYQRHAFTVRGTLETRGTGNTLATSVRLAGGRSDPGLGTQHLGVLFDGSGAGSLDFLTVADGNIGILQGGTGTVDLRDCRVENNGVGVSVRDGAAVRIVRSRIKDNGTGIQISGGSLVLRRSGIRGNAAAGILVNGMTIGATADADSCEFVENASGHLQIDTAGASVAFTLTNSNLQPIADGTPSVNIVTNLCVLVDARLRTNFWSQLADTPSDVLGFFTGRRDCNAGVSSWSLAAGDWLINAHILNAP